MNGKIQYFATLVQIFKAEAIIDLEYWTLECFIIFSDRIIPPQKLLTLGCNIICWNDIKSSGKKMWNASSFMYSFL